MAKALCLASALSVAGLATAGVVLRPRVLPPEGAVPGLRVGGAALQAGADVDAHVAELARALEARRIRLWVGERALDRSLGELGVSLDADAIARRARDVGRRGPIAVRVDELRRARRGEIDVPLAVRVDAERLLAALAELKEATDESAKPARFDLKTGAIQPHRPGRYLDLDAAITALHEASTRAVAELEAPRREIAPRVDAKLLAQTSIDVVIADFTTHFALDPNRGKNIEVAASRLDGIVLAPGELVSFNDVVGARTEDNGFKPAPEIYKGEMVQGIGGGTCQVSSTLHAAALGAGFDVVERYPHSRPSGYIPLGLDSTVSWPTVDLKLRNPWTFPIVVHTRVEKGKLRVELLGRERPATVTLARDTLAIRPFKRKITESSWLEEGRIIKKQKGILGYSIRKTRVIVAADGTRRVETTVDHYPPTPEHFVVPPGTAADDLPPLPEGAAEPEDEREATLPPSGAASG